MKMDNIEKIYQLITDGMIQKWISQIW